MAANSIETVTSVTHWNDTLFSFTTTRESSFRFRNGHFVMIGLEVEGKPLMRAYSVVSPNYEEHLEFLSIKVPDGPLTSRLQHIQTGDSLLVGQKATGTLVLDDLRPGRNLYLFSTGTGLAPFMSIVRDPETYERFEKLVLIHGVATPFFPDSVPAPRLPSKLCGICGRTINRTAAVMLAVIFTAHTATAAVVIITNTKSSYIEPVPEGGD